MDYVIEIAGILFEMCMIYLFLSSLLQPKRKNLFLPLSFAVFAAVIAVLSFSQANAFLRIGVSFAGVFLLSMVFFEAKPIWAISVSLIFCAIVMASDLLMTYLLLALGMDAAFLQRSGPVGQLFSVLGHLIEFVFVGTACMLSRRGRSTFGAPKMLLPLLPCVAISILFCIVLTQQAYETGKEVSPVYLWIVLGLLYTNLIVLYFMNRIRMQEHAKAEAELAEQHYSLQKEYYEQLHAQQEETRALWHDIKKYLLAIQTDGAEGSAMRELQERVEDVSRVVDVGNRVLDVILNAYLRQAEENQTRLMLDVQVPPELFVSTADLYILLGNTLDNALDACAELPEEKRQIRLVLRVQNDMLFYQIENPYSVQQEKLAHRIGHGYGLKNVQSCIKKYSGTVTISRENSTFQLIARLNRK